MSLSWTDSCAIINNLCTQCSHHLLEVVQIVFLQLQILSDLSLIWRVSFAFWMWRYSFANSCCKTTIAFWTVVGLSSILSKGKPFTEGFWYCYFPVVIRILLKPNTLQIVLKMYTRKSLKFAPMSNKVADSFLRTRCSIVLSVYREEGWVAILSLSFE